MANCKYGPLTKMPSYEHKGGLMENWVFGSGRGLG